jgi:hypothetical protein
MGKHFKHLLMLVIIFTALFLTTNCTKDEGNGNIPTVNLPPATPINPTPADNADSISIVPTLGWSVCTDPENDAVTYDIYLGKTNPPALIKSNSLLNSYKPDTLATHTKYYWKVIAKDSKNKTASSAVWNFTTAAPVQLPGNLAVLVCDALQTYWGGAEVFLYKTESDRTNDPQRTSYYQKATTDNSDPQNIGAVFYALTYQKYYVYARHDLGGGNFITGVGESFIQSGKTTKLTVKIQ